MSARSHVSGLGAAAILCGLVCGCDLGEAGMPDAGLASDAAWRPSDRQGCEGRFGPIAESTAEVVFVDAFYPGKGQDGSSARPFTTLQMAVDAAEDGATVAIAAGRYVGPVMLANKRLRLVGRCAARVTVASAEGTPTQASLRVVSAAGATLEGMTFTAGAPGVTIVDSTVTIRYCRLEDNVGAGLWTERSTVTFLDGEMVGTRPGPLAGGVGVLANEGVELTLSRTLVGQNALGGIDLPDTKTDRQGGPTRALPSSGVVVGQTDVADNGVFGLRIHGATAEAGSGYLWSEVPAEGDPSSVVRDCLFRGHGGYAIEASGATIHIVASRLSEAAILPSLEHGAVRLHSAQGFVSGNELVLSLGGVGVAAWGAKGVVVGNQVEGGERGVTAFFSALHIAGNDFARQRSEAVWAVGNDAAAGPLVVERNQVVEGGGFGSVRAAVYLQDRQETIVRRNVLASNAGVALYLTGALAGSVEENQISQSTRHASEGGHALVLFGCRGLRVLGNHIAGNQGTGILVFQSGGEEGLVIEENHLVDNEWLGVDVVHSNFLRVARNQLFGNRGFGIRALGDGVTTGRELLLEDNVITGTTGGNDAGDGVALVRVDATLRQNQIATSERAGLSATSGVGIVDETNAILDNGAYSGFFQDGDRMAVSPTAFTPAPVLSEGHVENVNLTVGRLDLP